MTALGEAVERAARALGVGWPGFEAAADDDACPTPLALMRSDGRVIAVVSGPHLTTAEYHVDDFTAALVLLCHALPETRERCPDCERRGGGWEWGVMTARIGPEPIRVPPAWRPSDPDKWRMQEVRIRVNVRDNDGKRRAYTITAEHCCRSCPTCTVDGKPTGWVPRSWGAVLLGAMPRPCDACNASGWTRSRSAGATECWKCEGHKTLLGNADDREALAVLADDRQRQGDPLGEWLALWLDAVPCELCRGDAVLFGGGEVGRCSHCRGSGLGLGTHTQAIAEALGRYV